MNCENTPTSSPVRLIQRCEALGTKAHSALVTHSALDHCLHELLQFFVQKEGK